MLNTLIEDTNEYLFGEPRTKFFSETSGTRRVMFPSILEDKQIVDMHYLWNAQNNQTIMLALYHGGTIASFKVHENYQLDVARKQLPASEAPKNITRETKKPKEPQP